ncbi:reticulophagy regulator 3-like isoform X2 [Ornithodoros turicata]|uniref:reticulophagy regulator 3-like isoform X2 n=1 Tax=Ornithodoros turicata TaxID=34597 RepID=UPI00313A141F
MDDLCGAAHLIEQHCERCDWFIVSCSRRFYSFAAILAAIIFMYKTWVNSIWPEIRVPPAEGEDTEQWTPVNPQVLSVPELNRYVTEWSESAKKWFSNIIALRKTHPGLFCTLACTMFTLTAVLGRMVSGVLIVYTLLMTVTLGPGIALYVVPETWYEQFDAIMSIASGKPPNSSVMGGDGPSGVTKNLKSDELEEFLPRESEETLCRQLSLSYDSESKSGTDSSTRSEEAAFAQELGTGQLASLEEESQGLASFPDGEDESDLDSFLPDLNLLPAAVQSKSGESMHFVAAHFREDSSESDSEDAFARGLTFSRPQKKSAEASKSRPLAVGPSRGGAAATKNGQGSRHPSQSSDIDINEYEIVDESDVST